MFGGNVNWKLICSSGALVVALGWAASAAAQQETPEWGARDDEAQALFQAGVRAYSGGHFEDAEEDFRRSYDLSGRPELLYNIATAAERANHDRVALDAYRRFLDALPDTDHRERVAVRIAALEQLTEQSRDESSGGDALGGWLLFGASLAVAVTGGVLVGVAVNDVSSVEGAPRLSEWANVEEAYERSEPLSIAGFVALSVGLVSATAGLVWALVGGGNDESPAETAHLDLRIDLGGLSLRGAF